MGQQIIPGSGGGGGPDPTALKIANNLSDLANAAAARANLGAAPASRLINTTLPIVGGGDLSADLTLSLDFSTTYTSAQLNALSSAASAKLRVAYCSDCYTSTGSATGYSVGALCYYNGYRWLTYSDRVMLTTDFLLWSLAVVRQGTVRGAFPQGVVSGEYLDASGATSAFAYQGIGVTTTSVGSNADSIGNYTFTIGTTAGVAGRLMSPLAASFRFGTAFQRNICVVLSLVPSSTARSGATLGVDDWRWRFGIEVPAYTATDAVSSDMFGFVMDDTNSLAWGATGTTLRAFTRFNSTNIDFVDSGIDPTTTPAFLIVCIEPTTSATGLRVRIASANDYAQTVTTHVDRTSNVATATTSLQPGIMAARLTSSTPTGRIVSRRFIRSVVLRTVSTTQTAFVN